MAEETAKPAAPAPELLRYQDVCGILGVSRRTVNTLVSKKRLKVIDLGHSTKRFRRSDVDKLLSTSAGDRCRLSEI